MFEEGTVDEDLLNEGNRRLRDYYQRLGYFDVKVEHQRDTPSSDTVMILYKIRFGVASPGAEGFGGGQSLLQREDIGVVTERSRCRSTGSSWNLQPGIGCFGHQCATGGLPEQRFLQSGDHPGNIDRRRRIKGAGPRQSRNTAEPLSVVYNIVEGQQQHVGLLKLDGAVKSRKRNCLP